MLIGSDRSAALVVCATCRLPGDAGARPRGERMLDALRAALVGHPAEGAVELSPMPCLFACASPCALYLRAPGKMGYVLGRFSPTREAATAVLDYAAAHLRSPEGTVPFTQWPEGVKGHFIARLPPEGFVWVEPAP